MPSVFISYSHKDEKWKDLVVQHLKVVADEHDFDVWDDRRIGPGADWKAEIERAIESADVALLLVSVDFLTSPFIRGEEVPPLLCQREEQKLDAVPIIVRSCAWRNVPWLARLSARPKDGQALGRMSDGDAEDALASIASEVGRMLARAAQRRMPGPPAVQQPEHRPDPPAAPDGIAWPEGVASSLFEFEMVTVDARGTVVSRQKRTAEAFTEWLDGVALEMVAIPGGTFVMGSPADEAGRLDTEGPQRTVTVAPFFIGKFEVTQAQWRVVARWPQVERALEAEPSQFKGENLPIEQVSWHDAIEFCARLSQRTGRTYRLPSEAEWEYAARAGTSTRFHFGPTVTHDLVNHYGDFPDGQAGKGNRRQATSVGSFGVANAFGLFDMHGNVFEWVQDPWHESYAGAPRDGRVWEAGGDPGLRVLRGGSWLPDTLGFDLGSTVFLPILLLLALGFRRNKDARTCRSAFRYSLEPGTRRDYVGFRVACACGAPFLHHADSPPDLRRPWLEA